MWISYFTLLSVFLKKLRKCSLSFWDFGLNIFLFFLKYSATFCQMCGKSLTQLFPNTLYLVHNYLKWKNMMQTNLCPLDLCCTYRYFLFYLSFWLNISQDEWSEKETWFCYTLSGVIYAICVYMWPPSGCDVNCSQSRVLLACYDNLLNLYCEKFESLAKFMER